VQARFGVANGLGDSSNTTSVKPHEFFGFDHRADHLRPPGMMEGIAKLPVLQGLKCFSLEPSSVGVAGAMIKAQLSTTKSDGM